MAASVGQSTPGETALVKTLYMDHHDLFKHTAVITAVGERVFKDQKFYWITLNETIFHPQGGGQLSDKGTINGRIVDYVHKEILGDLNHIEVLHCFRDPIEFEKGQTVSLEVDPENRHQNSLWHTAAHALDFCMVKCFPNLKGDSGQCYPGNAFMKFISTNGSYPDLKGIKPTVEQYFQAAQAAGISLEVVREDGIRKLKIGDHPIPCGGTHVHSLSELGQLQVKNATYEKKEGKLRVSYNITPSVDSDSKEPHK